MALESLQDLFINELKDVYNAEKQIVTALPRMAKAATAPRAAGGLYQAPAGDRRSGPPPRADLQVAGSACRGKKCKGMEGLLEEGKEILEEEGAAEVIDAALISAAQRVEHYEIAAYGCLRTYAKLLGHDDADKLLSRRWRRRWPRTWR